MGKKGFAIALMFIARRQKRDFNLILFSNDVKSFVFEKGKIKTGDIISLAAMFLGGGTNFEKPLLSALHLINKSRFNNADVIFLTDGEAHVSQQLIETIKKSKKEKTFSILGILVGKKNKGIVNQFADQVINVDDFMDKNTFKAFEI